MSRLPAPHKLLLLIHGLVAFAFYLYLDDYGRQGFWFLGWDELEHKEFARVLAERNPLYSLFLGERLTGNVHIGNGYLIMLSHAVLGSVEAYLLTKFALLALSTKCLYGLLLRYRGTTFAQNATLLYLLYLPLRVFEVSILKDDALVSLIVICAYALAQRRYLLAFFLSYLVFRFRLNAFPLPFIFYMFLARFRLLQLALPLAGLAAAYAVFARDTSYLAVLADLVAKHSYAFLFVAAKYFFGPLPWNLADYDTEYTHFATWYTLTLGVTALLLVFPATWRSIVRNLPYLVLLAACALGPYLAWSVVLDTVGPRQFTMAGFFYAIMIFEWIFRRRFTFTGSSHHAWTPSRTTALMGLR